MNKEMVIGTSTIEPGEEKQLSANISRLPTRTKIEIPIIVYRAVDEGPVVLFSGGMHGDEINGVEIVRRLVRNDYHKVKKGAVICIPVINIHGFLNFSRQVPDGKDINRSFPGSKTGSLASQIAFYLEDQILPFIDFGIDFHTGGSRINNFPQIRAQMDDARNKEIADVFGAKFLINSPLRTNSFRKIAAKHDKNILVFEGGESLRLRKHAIDEGVNGTLRVLHHFGMRDDAPPFRHESVHISNSKWIRAAGAGLYHSFVRPGEWVEKGDQLGLITDPFGEYEKPVKTTNSGHILSVNNNPVINRGDALIHIGFTL